MEEPRSAEEILEAVRSMRDSLKEGYTCREPEFVLTRSELTFLHKHDEAVQKSLKESRAYAERVDGLLLQRNEELAHERQLREGYQLAAELAIETKRALELERKELQRTIRRMEEQQEVLDEFKRANKEWGKRHQALEDELEEVRSERDELRDELVQLNPAEGEEEDG